MFNSKALKRIFTLFLCLTVVLGCIPFGMISAGAAGAVSTVADNSTYNNWEEYFRAESNNISTENSGGIWTDKSVFADDTQFAHLGIAKNNADDFFVALSAITSNMTITGQSNMPTDTVLVLDASGSMNSSNNDCAKQLVEAANESIQSLLDLNKHNRVSVVVYSGTTTSGGNTGSDAVVLVLPLDRYKTTSGDYLTYTKTTSGRNTTETVKVDTGVTSETTNDRPTTKDVSKKFLGATYTQRGIIMGLQQLENTDVTVTDNELGELDRLPIMVLMSDGVPTTCSVSYEDPFNSSNSKGYELGDGTTSSATNLMSFVTQLSAAYAKKKINEHYNKDCLFYTMGLSNAISGDAKALSVMNPEKTSDAINDYWEQFNNASVGSTITIDSNKIEKVAELEKIYVDTYFEVTGSQSQMQTGLTQAFQSIINEITLRSKFFPNLSNVGGDLSDSVSFVDEMGNFMRVKDVKGIILNDKLLSGVDVADALAGSNPSISNDMIEAIKQRLGLGDATAAKQVIEQAIAAGQISYNSKDDFSNYIGWYSNAAGQFLGFYEEGKTTLPAKTGNIATDPAMLIKSYIYLGEEDKESGITAADMLLTAVYVRENIETKDQTVMFSVPEKLLPSILYEVTLDNNGNPTDITVSGAKSPIALVCEIGMDPAVNKYNLKEKMTVEYLNKNTNPDGTINFYTNKYDVNNVTDYENSVNTYSYFQPALNNDRYYFSENTLIYSDENGTVYESATAPENTNREFYRRQVVYKKNNGALSKEYVYYKLSTEEIALVEASSTAPNQWVIPKGTVNFEHEHYLLAKNENKTDTVSFYNKPFMDYTNPEIVSGKEYYTFGAFLGNNGKMTFIPETGIKISKALSADATTTTEAFEFNLVNTTNGNDNSSYNSFKVNADGTTQETNIQFVNGAAKVYLKAGEAIYIGGMSVGDVIEVTETNTADYVVDSVNASITVKDFKSTVIDKVMGNAAFVNRNKGKGDLCVSKEIVHSYGSDYTIPEKEFAFELSLSGVGAENATFKAVKTNSSLNSITTDKNGKYSFTLKNGEQILIESIPEDLEAIVVEKDVPAGFTPSYIENGVVGDGNIDIIGDATANLKTINTYKAQKAVVDGLIKINGKKTLNGRDWKLSDSFTFKIESQQAGKWVELGTTEVKGTSLTKTFDFNSVISAQEYTQVGSYKYKITEVGTDSNGVKYDKTEHIFTVEVADREMDGKLEIADVKSASNVTEVKKSGGIWQVTADLKNEYSISSSATDFVKISGNKTLSNKDLTDGEFTFELYKADSSFVTVGSAYKTAINTSGEYSFKLDYTSADIGNTYYYVVKEANSGETINGITYSSKIYNVTVNVDDDTVGGIKATATVVDENGAVDVNRLDFVNTYKAEKISVGNTVKLVGTKTLSGREWKNTDSFIFKLEKQDGSNWVQLGTATVTGADDDKTFDFNALISAEEYSSIGVYTYRITEIKESLSGIEYDETAHIVTVSVTDDDKDGYLEISQVDGITQDTQVYKNSGVWTVETDFMNKYSVSNSAAAVVSFGGTKTLNNKEMTDGEFTFELYNADSTFATVGSVYKVSANTSGKFTFNIDYTSADIGKTYYYVVKEANAGETINGVTYSNKQYNVTVEVADDTLGGVKAKLEVSDETGTVDADSLDFVNEYFASPALVNLNGKKLLNGRELLADEFKFILHETDSTYTVNNLIAPVIAGNKADGTFTFGDISFTKAGKYYFVVTEDSSVSTERVTFDDSVYCIEINVTDDMKGKLVADTPIVFEKTLNTTVDEIVFTNKFTPKPQDKNVNITVNKTVVNKGSETITAEGFEFALAAVNGIQNVITTKSDENGKAVFVLSYTEDDIDKTYTYELTEVNTSKENVTYSTEKYVISVAISLNADNELVADLKLNDEAITDIIVDFENIYDYTTNTDDDSDDGSNEDGDNDDGDPDDVIQPDTGLGGGSNSGSSDTNSNENDGSKNDSDSNSNSSSGAPKTGDTSNVTMWLAVLFISSVSLFAILKHSKKEELLGV